MPNTLSSRVIPPSTPARRGNTHAIARSSISVMPHAGEYARDVMRIIDLPHAARRRSPRGPSSQIYPSGCCLHVEMEFTSKQGKDVASAMSVEISSFAEEANHSARGHPSRWPSDCHASPFTTKYYHMYYPSRAPYRALGAWDTASLANCDEIHSPSRTRSNGASGDSRRERNSTP